FLYFIMQNPLANPDVAAYQKARNTRLFKLERSTMRVVGEYVYTLDDPRSFRRDPSERQNDPRISEMMAIGVDRLILLERTEQTTNLDDLEPPDATDTAGSKWDDPATRPTLEQTEVAAAAIKPLTKKLRFDSAELREMVGKTEGIALLGDGTLALINDDHFGTTAAPTHLVLLPAIAIPPPQ